MKRTLTLIILLSSLARAGSAQIVIPPLPVLGPIPVSTATLKASGTICSTLAGTCSCTTFTDASVQSQWNVITCTLPIVLKAVGDEVVIDVDWTTANNANTKTYQFYLNGGTCSGSGGSMCSTGTQVSSNSTTNVASPVTQRTYVKKTGSGTQMYNGTLTVSTSIQNNYASTASITDTGTIAIAFGVTNTSAAAASVTAPNPIITIKYFAQ